MSSDPSITRDRIRQAVARELGVDPEEISDDANLIEFGIASLPLMRLAAQWRSHGADIDFARLAAEPRVEAWSRLLSAGEGASIDTVAVPSEDASAAEAAADPRLIFPLATMQHGYWVGRAEGQTLGGVAAHLYGEFDGQIADAGELRRAVETVTARHPALRTRFVDEGGQQVLDAPGKPVFSVIDLREETPAAVATRLAELRDERTHQVLDISVGQVIDVGLTLLPNGRSRLHVDVDMIAADAVSYRIILAEIARSYRGEELDPASSGYSYRRYLRDHDAATAASRARDAEWWAKRITDYPDAPALPLVSEIQMANPHRSERYSHQLSSEEYILLRRRAHSYGVTAAMVLATVFSDVIARWSANQRFLLNLPLFDREPLHPEVATMVGDFSNSILLDVTVDPAASFLDRAQSMQRNLHEHAAHAARRGLDVLRDLGRQQGSPVLAPVVYTSALDLGEMYAPVVAEELGEPVWTISQGPQVVLDAQVSELAGGVLLNWDVRRDSFPPGVIEEMFHAYRGLIETLIAPDAKWTAPHAIELPVSQQEVRDEVNDTARNFPARTLHGAFFGLADTRPDAPAVLWGESGQVSYGQLAEQSLRVAAALRDSGVRAGDTVAIQLRKGHLQVPAVLGVLAAGAAYLPIGEDQPPVRRNAILDKGLARVTIVEREINDLPQDVTAVLIDTALNHASGLREPVDVSPEAIAYVLFTSGSTGEPKGVEIPHQAAANTIDGVVSVFDLTERDRTLGVSVLEFDPSVIDIFGVLSLGGAFVAVDADEAKDAFAWAQLARRHRATAITCAPGILRMLLDVATPDQLRHLHAVMLGGDWVTVDLPKKLRELAPRARFAGLGGTTETAVHCTVCEVSGDIPEHWQAVPYGTPLPNFACRVVNQSGQDSPDWVPGELWVGGISVGAGYRGDPERTAEKFTEAGGRRWYRTGDLARYLPDGTLEFLGRADHQVKVRGYRIELGEVEAALRAVEGVGLAIVETVATGTARLVAAVTTTRDLRGAELQDRLAQTLPPYMIPSHIEVVDAFPLTVNGKLDRRAVRAALEASGAGADAVTYPKTSLEAALQHIVAGVLSNGLESVSADFFAAGGDSILATTAIAHIRSLLQVTTITAADFFTARSVRELAARLTAREDVPDQLETIAEIYLEVAGVAASAPQPNLVGEHDD